jgi:FMN-dependent NADH-azoreductase
MNVLHVCANPRPIEESTTKQLAAAFFSRLVEKNPEAAISNVDLYQEPPPFLSYAAYSRLYKPLTDPGYKATKQEEDAIKYASAQGEALRQADVLVLTMPLWCGGPPAIMKAWFDQVFSPGIVFDMGADGIKPLHQLRRVVVLTASGDVYKENDPRDGLTTLLNNNFGFVGVTDIAYAWADGQDPMTHDDAEDRKQTALEAAQDLAEEIAELP